MPRAIAILLCIVACLPGRARATTFAAMDDADLVAASEVVVTGTVADVVARRSRQRIVTDATVAVGHVLKGAVDGMSLVVTTPGGHVGDDWAVVFGTPELAAGDEVLLFLQRTRRGELRTTALALGAFRLTTGPDGAALAERRLVFPEVRPLADFTAIVQALGDPGASVAAATVAPAPADQVERFTFLGAPPSRWFEADSGQTVRYLVANADPMLGSSTSRAVLDAAFAAWTDVPTATIQLARGGGAATGPSVAGGTCDGSSVVEFNDPNGEIPALVGCSGVLAIGGFCVKATTGIVGGQTYRRISEGDLTINDGLGSCINRKGYEEIVTHEVGHTIGLGHSSENENEPDFNLRDATMFFLAHLDGRGASLRADDVAGVSALYAAQVDPFDLDGDGIVNDADACPSTPQGTPVDATGCGCDESGHAVCDDGLSCTTDRCNPATGGCVADPLDCTGGEPCVTGACDEGTGCATTPVTGDVAVLCVYDRPFPPSDCASERLPRGLSKRFRRAGRLARTGVDRGDARFLDKAGRQLDKARRIVDRAAARSRHALGAACASALDALVDEARARLTPLD